MTNNDAHDPPDDWGKLGPEQPDEFVQRARWFLTALAVVSFVALLGTRLVGNNGEYAWIVRSILGHLTALSLVVGSLFVVFRVHAAPRLASRCVVAASFMVLLSEMIKVANILIDPTEPLFDTFETIALYLGATTLICFMNLAMFEMSVQKQRVSIEGEKRMLTEIQRLRSEDRYRALFDAASDGIVIVSQDDKIDATNRSISNLLGFDESEMLGEPASKFLDPAMFATMVSYLNDNRDRPQGQLFETRLIGKDGKAREVEISLAHLPANEVLVFVRDISRRKELEAQIQSIQRIDSIGRLAGGVAHDFNNALTPILGHTELLLMEHSSNDELRNDLQEIWRAAEHAQQLTRQLLAFGRKQTMQMATVNMNAVIMDFKNILRRIVREDVAIELALAPSLGHVRADMSQLEQVLMNLSVNAQDAMPNGGTLTIETQDIFLDESHAATHASVQPGPHVMLVVSDTGIGMDEATLSKVFEPFFTTKEHGNGFGLATVYGIVKQHQGSVWMYSEPGQGTSCRVYLPRVEDAVTASSKGTRPVNVRGNLETILVVEDTDSVRDFVCTVLERNNYTVLRAASGGECLSLLEKHSGEVQLLLSDVIMPGMNGRELHILLSARYPAIKVLFMSGYSDNIIAKHGLLDEGTQFIQKPLTSATLTA